MISPDVIFIFFLIFFFGLLGGKRAKNNPKLKIITSVMHHISVLVVNFFKVLIFWAVRGGRGVNGQKIAQNEKQQ